MKLSVVITTYSRPDDLADCLRSLDRQFDPPTEVIVVDDGDVDETETHLKQAGIHDMTIERIHHLEGEDKGLPAARNRGIDAAAGDVVCFVDDDVILPPNWTRELKQTYAEFPEAVGVGGYVLNYNPPDINKANVDSFGYRLLQGFRKAFFYTRIGKVSPVGILYAPHVFMTSSPCRVGTLQGCNMSFRAAVFDEQSFDEWYGRSGSSAAEELDFSVRVARYEGDLVYNPRLVALHKRTIGEAAARSGSPNYGNVTNLTYFSLKRPDSGLMSLVLLILAISVYTAIKLDPRYLAAVKKGIDQYKQHGQQNMDGEKVANKGPDEYEQ